MSIWDTITNWAFGSKIAAEPLDLKRAYEAQRIGVNGRVQYPETNRAALLEWQRRNELVYACIRKKCEAAADPDLVVERQNNDGEWETIPGHPLAALLKKPNFQDTFDTFLSAWIGSEECAGDFYAEIIRNRLGQPAELYPLNPSMIRVVPQGAKIARYVFDPGDGREIPLRAEDVLHRRKPDIVSRFYGLAPLRVAIGAVDSDASQTDFVRAFFHGDGVPSGILSVEGSPPEMELERVQKKWMRNYSRGGDKYKEVAVLTSRANYQKIGSSLNEIESDSTRSQAESRICMVFGVPPILVGAYVGLLYVNQRASAREAMADFWLNTMSPMLKSMRVFLTETLLPQFGHEEEVRQGTIRVNWDMAQVMALQEDETERQTRARENFKSGGLTLNEFREAIGKEPLDGGEYFLLPRSLAPITPERQAEDAEKEPQPLLLGDGSGNSMPTDALDADLVEDEAKVLLKRFENDEPGSTEDLRAYIAKRLWSEFQTNLEKERAKAEKSAACAKFTGLFEDTPPHTNGKGYVQQKLEEGLTPEFIESRKKKYEYEGLTLSREPTELEKSLDLKGMVEAQETQKEKCATVLKSLRSELIKQATSEIQVLGDKDVYSLTLTPPAQAYKKVGKVLREAFEAGQGQVAMELAKQDPAKKKTFGDKENAPFVLTGYIVQKKDLGDILSEIIQRLAEITVSRVVNEVQTRAVNLFSAFKILGKSNEEISEEMEDDLREQSESIFDLFAGSGVNAAVQAGRRAEMSERSDEIKYYEYSAILDGAVCDNCKKWDGERVDSMSDLPETPNSSCSGLERCRCFTIAVAD